MWKSRQIVTRQLHGVALDDAAQSVKREGFQEADAGGEYAHFRKPGSRLTMSIHKMPLDLTLSAVSPSDTEMKLRYGTFVLFDTGDLEDEADRLAGVVGAPAEA